MVKGLAGVLTAGAIAGGAYLVSKTIARSKSGPQAGGVGGGSGGGTTIINLPGSDRSSSGSDDVNPDTSTDSQDPNPSTTTSGGRTRTQIDRRFRVTPKANVSFTQFTSDPETGAYRGP